jgi:hypothetical protein
MVDGRGRRRDFGGRVLLLFGDPVCGSFPAEREGDPRQVIGLTDVRERAIADVSRAFGSDG